MCKQDFSTVRKIKILATQCTDNEMFPCLRWVVLHLRVQHPAVWSDSTHCFVLLLVAIAELVLFDVDIYTCIMYSQRCRMQLLSTSILSWSWLYQQLQASVKWFLDTSTKKSYWQRSESNQALRWWHFEYTRVEHEFDQWEMMSDCDVIFDSMDPSRAQNRVPALEPKASCCYMCMASLRFLYQYIYTMYSVLPRLF